MKASEVIFTSLVFLTACFLDFRIQETQLLRSINSRFDILQKVADQDHVGASLAIGFHGNIDTSFTRFSDYRVSGAYLLGHGKKSVVVPGNIYEEVPNDLGIWTSESDLWFGLDLGWLSPYSFKR